MRIGEPIRVPAVAGSFYPATQASLATLVGDLIAEASRLPRADPRAEPRRGGSAAPPMGLLVPHAGLDYSGVLAASAWATLLGPGPGVQQAPGAAGLPMTVVILGTNHRAGWLNGIGAWEAGAWRTPLGDVTVDEQLARAIVDLGPPFTVDRDAHAAEHSIEVQLPLLQTVAPYALIVPLAVSVGTGAEAIDAGRRVGKVLAGRQARGQRIVLAVSTDMAHYPPRAATEEVTEALLPSILGMDPALLAAREAAIRSARIPGLVCGMCGIEPAIGGLAALRQMGATSATSLAASTSADRGGPPNRTVGYLAVRFDR